jgi:hypothetical protein
MLMPADDIIIACWCSHLGHSIRFTYYPTGPHDRGAFEAYVDVMLDYDRSLWRRLRTAWRYLTRRVCGYGDAGEILLRREDLPRIRAWLDRAGQDAENRPKDA